MRADTVLGMKWGLGVVAWLFDSTTLVIAAGAVYLVANMSSATAAPGLMLKLQLGSAIGAGIYHVGWAGRTQWFSPGEWFAGRAVREGAKTWRNPYTRNRLPLFGVAGITLWTVVRLVGMMVSFGVFLDLGSALARLGIWVVVVTSLSLAGRGHAGMLTLTSVFWLLVSVEERDRISASGGALDGVVLPLLATFACLALAVFYSRSKQAADSAESA